MSYPTEIDFAIVRIGDGTTPEVFTVVCGLENATVNETANTSDRFRSDCENPGRVPTRSVRVTGVQWDVTGSGVSNSDQIPLRKAALGKHRNYQIDAIEEDGTDAGKLLGTFAGRGVMTANNLNLQRTGDSTGDITIAGENDLTWTPAA